MVNLHQTSKLTSDVELHWELKDNVWHITHCIMLGLTSGPCSANFDYLLLLIYPLDLEYNLLLESYSREDQNGKCTWFDWKFTWAKRFPDRCLYGPNASFIGKPIAHEIGYLFFFSSMIVKLLARNYTHLQWYGRPKLPYILCIIETLTWPQELWEQLHAFVQESLR